MDEAERLVVTAERRLAAGEPSLAAVAAEVARAVLSKGALLEDEPDVAWANDQRRIAHERVRRARRASWTAALDLGDRGTALEVATAAVASDPLDEEDHRAVMLAHYEGGESVAALAAYERLRKTLVEELGADPGADTEALYVTILRGDAPSRPQVPLAHASAAPTSPSEADFVGRADELARLAQAWSAAADRQPSVILLVGEGGVGKTRLAEELAHLARGTGGVLLLGRCYEAEHSLFIQPVVEALRSFVVSAPPDVVRDAAGEWAGTLGELVPEIRQMLWPVGYERAPGQLELRRSFEAVTTFLQRLSERHTVLVLLDDLHEAGQSTLELLHFLARRLSRERILILATVRAQQGVSAIDQLSDAARVSTLARWPTRRSPSWPGESGPST